MKEDVGEGWAWQSAKEMSRGKVGEEGRERMGGHWDGGTGEKRISRIKFAARKKRIAARKRSGRAEERV